MKDGHLFYNSVCHFAFDSDNPISAGTSSVLKFRPHNFLRGQRVCPEHFTNSFYAADDVMTDIGNTSKSCKKKWSAIYYPFHQPHCPSTTKNFLIDLILCIYAAYNVYSILDFSSLYAIYLQGSCFLAPL